MRPKKLGKRSIITNFILKWVLLMIITTLLRRDVMFLYSDYAPKILNNSLIDVTNIIMFCVTSKLNRVYHIKLKNFVINRRTYRSPLASFNVHGHFWPNVFISHFLLFLGRKDTNYWYCVRIFFLFSFRNWIWRAFHAQS